MKISGMFPSKYLKASDLDGHPDGVILKIAASSRDSLIGSENSDR